VGIPVPAINLHAFISLQKYQKFERDFADLGLIKRNCSFGVVIPGICGLKIYKPKDKANNFVMSITTF